MDVLLDRLREWTVGEWVAMLFDTLTAALFVGGCLLLWLNLRRHRRVRLTAVPTEEEPANPRPEAGQFKTTASPESHEATIEYAADASLDQSVCAVGDQDGYASRVVLAMKRAGKLESAETGPVATTGSRLSTGHLGFQRASEPHRGKQ
jgi:hypothetical protein